MDEQAFRFDIQPTEASHYENRLGSRHLHAQTPLITTVTPRGSHRTNRGAMYPASVVLF